MKKDKTIYKGILTKKQAIAVLIDPEKSQDEERLKELLDKAVFAHVDYLFIGGSTVTRSQFERTAEFIHSNCSIPLIIFPGSSQQLSPKADAILFLSLVSGRNPDFLIGHHVQSAEELFYMDIEIIPTAYMLIEGGTQSSVAYVSQTTPIPRDKINIVVQTAMAARMQGKKMLYLDAGSGAKMHVPAKMVEQLKIVGLPIIIGGGVRDTETIQLLHQAGANIVVIGNKLEEDTDLLLDIRNYQQELNEK